MDKRPVLIALGAALIAMPAFAAHCPHGQFFRVRLDKCVALGSPLALAFEGHVQRERLKPAVAGSFCELRRAEACATREAQDDRIAAAGRNPAPRFVVGRRR
jgi:hypothetical protein